METEPAVQILMQLERSLAQILVFCRQHLHHGLRLNNRGHPNLSRGHRGLLLHFAQARDTPKIPAAMEVIQRNRSPSCL